MIGSTAWDWFYSCPYIQRTRLPDPSFTEVVADLPSGSALDLGCGEGANAIWLARHGWRTLGIDCSLVALKYAKTLGTRQGVDISLICGDVAMGNIPSASFDLVCVLYVHLPRQLRLRFWDAAKHAVSAGGHVVVVGFESDGELRAGEGPADVSLLINQDELLSEFRDYRIRRLSRVRSAIDQERPHSSSGVRVVMDAQRM